MLGMFKRTFKQPFTEERAGVLKRAGEISREVGLAASSSDRAQTDTIARLVAVPLSP